jgi:acyl carrier protein
MIDFIELFNAVTKVAKPAFHKDVIVRSETELFRDAGLDSLDMLMVCIFFSDIYGISEEDAKMMLPKNIVELKDFITQYKTKEPSSVHEAIELIK